MAVPEEALLPNCLKKTGLSHEQWETSLWLFRERSSKLVSDAAKVPVPEVATASNQQFSARQ